MQMLEEDTEPMGKKSENIGRSLKKAYKTEEGDCPHAGEIQGSANVMGN